MISSRKLILFPKIVIGVFFIAYFLYFALFNRYSLAYQEQIQLFRFDWNYFTSFLTKPGGLSEYISTFFVQFYLCPLAAVLIITVAGIATYALTGCIFRKYNIFGIFWSSIPVLLLVALESDYTYSFVNTIGLLFALTFTVVYISIRQPYIRYITGFIGWVFLYLAIGGFSFLATLLCILNELFFTKNHYRLLVAFGFVLMAALFPFLAWHYIYFIPIFHAWSSPLLLPRNRTTQYCFIILFAYFPFLLIVIKTWLALAKKKQLLYFWTWKTILAGMIIFCAFAWGITKYAYDSENEILFRMDSNIQNAKWDEVLKLSSMYPSANHLNLFFTNLALYKSGKLGSQMFHYNQIDASCLWLDLPGTKFPYYFGFDVFYHLGFINKAYRWAFDAMVATGYSPRLLKQLVLISLIKGDNAISEKYLNVLDQTLFYRKWTQRYHDYLHDPKLLLQDREILEKRHLLINADVIEDTNNPYSVLILLLENHADNRMAFEYYMASLLLDKDLTAFVDNIKYLKYYGYKDIPVHFEEALIEYMFNSQKNIVPEGFVIRESTIQRFKDFLKAYSSFTGNLNLEAQRLYKPYGTTYWYYSYFKNTQVKIR